MELIPKCCRKGFQHNKVWVKTHTRADPDRGYWAYFIKRGSRTAISNNGRTDKRNRYIPAMPDWMRRNK